jgi:hypothetical protein
MHSTTIKRTIATMLSGAAIAGTIAAPAASGMPIDPVAARGEPPGPTVPPTPPSGTPAASATDESWQPAMTRYDDLEANRAKSMQALGLAMVQQSLASPHRDVEASEARTAQAR